MATREELLEQAGDLDITGRHQMSKAELEEAVDAALQGSEDQDEGSEVSGDAKSDLEDESDEAAQDQGVAEDDAGTQVSEEDQAAVESRARTVGRGRSVGFRR